MLCFIDLDRSEGANDRGQGAHETSAKMLSMWKRGPQRKSVRDPRGSEETYPLPPTRGGDSEGSPADIDRPRRRSSRGGKVHRL